VGGQLLTLVRKELIRPDHAIVPGDDGFRFGHALIRDAAYDEIPKRQRAVLHQSYAAWLTSRLGDHAPDEIIGYHLEQSYRYGADLGAADPVVGERAAERLARAGEAAHARGDMHAVANLLSRAADLIPGHPRRPALLAELGAALHSSGEIEHALSVLEEAVTLANGAGDGHVEWLARIELAATQLETESGDPEAAFREGEAAVAARASVGDHEVLARAWHLIGTTHNWRSQAAEWRDASEHAVTHARETGDLALEVQMSIGLAGPIVYGPVPVEEGLRFADDLMARFGDVPEVQGFAAHVRSHMRARLGEFDGAFEGVNVWRHHIHELGQEIMYAGTASCVWDVCSWARDWTHGEQVLRESYEMFERMGLNAHRSTIAAHLGEAVLHQGRVDEAETLSSESEQLGTSDDVYNEMAWRRLRAKVAAAQGDLDQARALAKHAVEIAAGVGFLDEVALAWLDLAEILQAADDAEARTAGGEALGLFERKGNLVGAQWARELLDQAGRSPRRG
jgi:tetratricopeptide (TPR) repeat protein